MTSILVGIDGSPEAKAALAWALEDARQRDADLTVMHVYHPPEELDPYLSRTHFPSHGTVEQLAGESQRWRDEHREIAHREAERVIVRALREVDPDGDHARIKTVAIPGRPARRLVEASSGADLLVVGSRGRGGFRDLKLGSVSEQCVRHAKCPVVVVRPKSG